MFGPAALLYRRATPFAVKSAVWGNTRARAKVNAINDKLDNVAWYRG